MLLKEEDIEYHIVFCTKTKYHKKLIDSIKNSLFQIITLLSQKMDFKIIEINFGCCRFIYNYFLDYSNSNGYGSKYANNNTCNRELKSLYPWLREIDKFAITKDIYNLDNAYKRYMNKLGGKPIFKKKNIEESYQTNYTNNIEVLVNIGKKYNKSSAQVILRWLIQRW